MSVPRYCLLIVGIAVWMVLVGCQGPQPAPDKPAFSEYQSPYPKGSGVAISPALEADAIRSLRQYVKQQYGVDKFEIVARASLGPAQPFSIDGAGRLVAGSLHEVWTVMVSGRRVELEFVMISDGRRGNTVGFREYHPPAAPR
jgi:hypothetical protein